MYKLDRARWQYFLLFEVGMKYIWPGTYRRPSSSSSASNTQPYQGAGLHKFEATVGKVKNKMLPNPPFMGIKMTVYWCWLHPCMIYIFFYLFGIYFSDPFLWHEFWSDPCLIFGAEEWSCMVLIYSSSKQKGIHPGRKNVSLTFQHFLSHCQLYML